MNGLEALLGGMGNGTYSPLEPITGEERENIAIDMQPIADLKPGDRLIWKSESMRDKKFPELGQVIEVFRLFDDSNVTRENGSNHVADSLDFVALFRTDTGVIEEHAFDSRRFNRIG